MKFLLLQDWQGSDPTGWMMSEKLDGWRVRYIDGMFYHRGGLVTTPPAWFTEDLPEIELDGELFAGRGGFYNIAALNWEKLSFHPFDAPGPEPFRERSKRISGIKNAVRYTRCKGIEHLLETADSIVAEGGEGVVLRNPRASYAEGRSEDVIRWVPQDPSLNRTRKSART